MVSDIMGPTQYPSAQLKYININNGHGQFRGMFFFFSEGMKYVRPKVKILLFHDAKNWFYSCAIMYGKIVPRLGSHQVLHCANCKMLSIIKHLVFCALAI